MRAKSFENSDFHKENALDSGVPSTHVTQDSSPKATSLDSANPPSPARIYKAPDDYKINQCHAQTLFVEKDSDRFGDHTRLMLDENFTPLPFQFSAANLPRTQKTPPKPQCFAMMIDMAKSLAKPIDFVRVDLYACGERPYVGELTFTPACGTSPFNPQKWDKYFGDLWR